MHLSPSDALKKSNEPPWIVGCDDDERGDLELDSPEANSRRRRTRAGVAVIGVIGSVSSRAALALLVPALGACWTAFVMLRIRQQLSPDGAGWERHIQSISCTRDRTQ